MARPDTTPTMVAANRAALTRHLRTRGLPAEETAATMRLFVRRIVGATLDVYFVFVAYQLPAEVRGWVHTTIFPESEPPSPVLDHRLALVGSTVASASGISSFKSELRQVPSAGVVWLAYGLARPEARRVTLHFEDGRTGSGVAADGAYLLVYVVRAALVAQEQPLPPAVTRVEFTDAEGRVVASIDRPGGD